MAGFTRSGHFSILWDNGQDGLDYGNRQEYGTAYRRAGYACRPVIGTVTAF